MFETQRISRLETRMRSMEKRILGEMKSINSKVSGPAQVVPAPLSSNSVWADRERVELVKRKASFMVRPVGDGKPSVSASEIGSLAAKHSIPVHRTATDSVGRTWVTTDDQVSCDKLKSELSKGQTPVDVVDIYRKTPTVVLVGITEDIDKNHIFDHISKVNSSLTPLMTTSSFRILAIKRTRKSMLNSNSRPVFQCVVAISDAIRNAIKNNGDRVFFRENSLHVYDQFHIKRCNKCQSFHHYNDKCSSPSHVCANCAGAHSTADCSVDTSDASFLKCANCSKHGNGGDVAHKASDSKCPSFKAEQDKLKRSIEYYNPKAPKN